MINWFTQLDFSVLYWIQHTFRCAVFDYFMPKITFLGELGLIWLVFAAILLCLPKYRRAGILLLASLAIGVLIGNVALKNLFLRSRPFWLDPSVRLLISVPRDYSFPSGHTLSSVIAASILTAADRRFGYAVVPLAVLIAFSRLYLFVHFSTDVLASVILGLVIGHLVWKYGSILLNKIMPQQENM